MPLFTIESTFDLPVFRHASYDAPDLASACQLALQDDDWSQQRGSWDGSGATYITGAWAGRDTAYAAGATEYTVPLPFTAQLDQLAGLLAEAMAQDLAFSGFGCELPVWFAAWRERVRAVLPNLDHLARPDSADASGALT
jgi:hypothetical protein